MNPLIRVVELFVLPGLVILSIIMLEWRRRRHAPGADTTRGWPSVWAWILIFCLVFFVVDLIRSSRWDQRAWSFLAWFVPVLILVKIALAYLVAWSRQRDEIRAARAMNRGDVAGAIADLEARVAPDLAAEAAPDPGTDVANPWAAPRSAVRSAALARRLNLLCILELKQEDWPRALLWAERVEQSGGSTPEYRANRAVALGKSGRVGEALALIRATLDAVPSTNALLRCRVMLQLASILINDGQTAEARAVLLAAEAESGRIKAVLFRQRRELQGLAQSLTARLLAAEARVDPAAL